MKAALYARVSTGRQADNDLSVPDQLRQMRDWCKLNNYHVVEEYKDEGASGTDDKRSGFQQMLAEVLVSPAPVDAIVCYSLSRIYRNHLELGRLIVDLKKIKVKLESITQKTPEDAAGEMVRSFFGLFDEYQSKQNGANTLRCMIQNANRGYFNGSSVPFGYQLQETSEPARSGYKKRLIINPEEVRIVKRMFNLYIERNLGVKGIAALLNEEGIQRRGNLWSIQNVYLILTNPVYMGQKLFNQREWKTRQKKDEQEIIRISVPSIVSEEIFELVQEKMASRSPQKSHPRRLTSPRLLTGILRCGECGAAMTLATGKSNTYFYYRCTTRTRKHLDLCSSKMVSMEKFDRLVLNALADKVFTLSRVAAMLTELKNRLKQDNGVNIQELTKRLQVIQFRLNNLIDAIADNTVEKEDVKDKIVELKQQKADVSAKIASHQQSPQALVDSIDLEEVKMFAGLMRQRLLDQNTPFSKEYLQLLVKEIVLKGNQATIKGSYKSLVGAVRFTAEKKNLSTPDEVLRFNDVWRARQDSNLRPQA